VDLPADMSRAVTDCELKICQYIQYVYHFNTFTGMGYRIMAPRWLPVQQSFATALFVKMKTRRNGNEVNDKL
jgi:hypothetical protein